MILDADCEMGTVHELPHSDAILKRLMMSSILASSSRLFSPLQFQNLLLLEKLLARAFQVETLLLKSLLTLENLLFSPGTRSNSS